MPPSTQEPTRSAGPLERHTSLPYGSAILRSRSPCTGTTLPQPERLGRTNDKRRLISGACCACQWYPRRDSNPRTRLRRPALYPTELRGRSGSSLPYFRSTQLARPGAQTRTSYGLFPADLRVPPLLGTPPVSSVERKKSAIASGVTRTVRWPMRATRSLPARTSLPK